MAEAAPAYASFIAWDRRSPRLMHAHAHPKTIVHVRTCACTRPGPMNFECARLILLGSTRPTHFLSQTGLLAKKKSRPRPTGLSGPHEQVGTRFPENTLGFARKCSNFGRKCPNLAPGVCFKAKIVRNLKMLVFCPKIPESGPKHSDFDRKYPDFGRKSSDFVQIPPLTF